MFHRQSILYFCILALACVLTRTAWADLSNKKTTVTFSAPVEIPGKVLPAGTYVFKVLDEAGNRNVVQIFNEDETQLIATVLAIPDYRQIPPGKTIINFEERSVGTPEAIKEWFYPGDNYGVQFVYPHDQATRIAGRTRQNVLQMRNEMQPATPAKSASDQSVKQMENTDVTGVDPNGNQIDQNQVVSPKRQK